MSGQPFPYSQTILLDCNRRQSVEFSASNLANTNTAIFTNQVSSGITLDIGDQVSIQSAHIAARGAGGSIIEFAGKNLGQKTIEYTQQTNTSYIGTSEFLIENIAQRAIQNSPEGYAMEENENITELIQENDNEANLVISYYKNTNGENYIGLPRNFGNASSSASKTAHGAAIYYSHLNNAADFWEVPDGYPVGANTFVQNASHRFDGDWYRYAGKSASGQDCHFYKIKNDNSRFTLFKQKFIVWNSNYVTEANASRYLLNTKYSGSWETSTSVSDPALHDYIKVKKKIHLSVPVGFNSPASVAADITNQLSETEDPVFIDPEGVGNRQSVYVNSQTNRAFPSANYITFQGLFNHVYFNADFDNGNPYEAPGPPDLSNNNTTNMATQYLNSYAYVGFKRPEIVETGRRFPNRQTSEINPMGARIVDTILTANASSAVIGTTLQWTEENLLKIKDFFEAQELYPELLKSPFTSNLSVGDQSNYSATVNPTSSSLAASFAEEARFLHMDLTKVSPFSGSYEFDPLGNDMYNVSSINGTYPDESSVPIFVAYNKNSSHLTSANSDGTSFENLVYGFAIKYNWVAGGVYTIGFSTEKIGGIPSSYFSANNGSISQNTLIGYDWHFNAFGNAAIIPSSGFFPVQYFGQQAFLGAQTVRQAYIGANDPIFKFNDVEGRFEFEQLHTAERVGNFYNAGDPDPTASVFGPPETGQAGQNCYKIDKQLHYSTWSPHMFGYSTIDVKESTDKTKQKSFVAVNENLEIGRIYDSHGGICIEDLGYNEKDFDQGFWGLCGFEYGQFNASGANKKNRLIKFSDNTKNVVGMTTNADIQSVDSQSYINNVYGANLFTQQLSTRIDFHNQPIKPSNFTSNASIVSPASTILTNSTRISAAQLPRRILRGYFLLNSDILDQANFYQTANPLQTMAMVGKYNGANDFIQYDGGGAVFTVTRKKTITSIKSQILDPEGGLAQVGDNSGIVYRIDKQINTDLKFAENLFAEMNSKK
jgi:hypothetical protein